MILRDPGLVIADRWQRGFPLCARPYAEIGAAHDLSEQEVIASLGALLANASLGRVGAVVRPNTAGASTLAALSCPPERIGEVAAIVSGEPYVNHNYERGHAINLWFVVAAPSERELSATLRRIAGKTGLEVLDLRLERPYHIDLGFRLAKKHTKIPAGGEVRQATTLERGILAAIENGLPLVPRPYLAVARGLGLSEQAVIEMLGGLVADGIIARLGCVLRHRTIGFTANAMAVWNVPDGRVDEVGLRLAAQDDVTLCYRRNRFPPSWRYNLFAMIHGRREAEVRARIGELAAQCGLADYSHDVLFSRRCFIQRGARFALPVQEAAA